MVWADVWQDIQAERARQNENHGTDGNDLLLWLPILAEEVGEVARALLSQDETPLYRELIQVAAIAVAMREQAHSCAVSQDDAIRQAQESVSVMECHDLPAGVLFHFRDVFRQAGRLTEKLSSSEIHSCLRLLAADCVYLAQLVRSGNAEWV